MTIKGCKIHPAIGVARVGNSPTEYFIGPERPGRHDPPGDGRYKDGAGYIKRQAARFRIFGYDEDGQVVRELTADDAVIQWTVHLANRKAAADRFRPTGDERVRNKTVAGADRDGLVIDPGPVHISGRNARDNAKGKSKHRSAASVFGVGDIPAVDMKLGELRTDEAGRLVVLGGHGLAEAPGGQRLAHFADNDGWCDDTSDGPVQATVRLTETGEEFVADPSWVIVAPPDFAPSIGNVVTLLDVVEQAVADARALPEPDHVDFDRDILPLLRRVTANQWVDATAFRGHRRGDQDPTDATAVERRGDFTDLALLALLADPGPGPAQDARQRVLAHVRAPVPPDGSKDQVALDRAKQQATASYMPPLSGDGGRRTEGETGTWLTVTPLQYRRLELWAEGKFVRPANRAAEPEPGETTSTDLDRAALENCVGGGFFPGIEVSKIVKESGRYLTSASPGDWYRLNPEGLPAGSLTEHMAVPWQADFALCEGFWWPAQRPDQVVIEHDYEVVRSGRPETKWPGPHLDTLALPRRAWARGIGDRPRAVSAGDPLVRLYDMVDRWSALGFVVPRADADPPVWVESERAPYFGLRDRDYFHIMLNLDDHPEFEPVARELATWFFADAARKIDNDRELDSELHYFDYDDTRFAARLDSIYRFLADQVAAYDPAEDRNFRTPSDVVERIRQFGPINLTDGAWLQNIDAIPPIPRVTDLLTTIWADENGDGDERYNHAHIYAELMRSVNLEPAPVSSLEYSEDPKLLDSAFTAPLLQLVAAQFTKDFLPEILGMTLYFEWESVWLMYVVKLFEYHGIDPRFYRVHLAIDNVAEGHGAMATRAVRNYLDAFEGEQQQQEWRRIWNGYVAFREVGTLGRDIKDLLHPKPESVVARMMAMIERKKQFGNLNHGNDGLMTNDLFDDPRHLLEVFAKDRRLVTPGQPHRSGLLRLFTIDGPMYRVFTAEEQELWAEWIRSLAAPPPQQPAPPGGPQLPPVPGGPGGHRRRLTFASPEAAFDADPRGLRGCGGLQ
jgi:hypothetical protein